MTKKKTNPSALADLQKRAAKAQALLAELSALFPEAAELPTNDRTVSQGRMGLEESGALVTMCDVVEYSPAPFAGLADEDEGDDPNKVETDLVRERFGEHDVYRGLAASLDEVSQLFSDTAIAKGLLVKPFALAVYEIAKPVSKRDAKLRGLLAPLLNYYGTNAKLAAEARKANKANDPSKGGAPPAAG
jgi:hypothetical protein